MNNLFLKDLFNLTDEEISNSKIALNMYSDKDNDITAFQTWDNSKDENNREVWFSYWSHYSFSKNRKERNFKNGQLCFGFIKLPSNNNRWLLVTVGKIVSVPNAPDFCEYKEVEKYSGFLGRLIIDLDKGNTYQRYVFNLSKYIDKIKVVELLPHDYQKIIFDGYDNVQLSYHDLKIILDNLKYHDYRIALSKIKGIYCLTDTNTGHLYIGSASGEFGLAQRWNDYINTKNGGNKALIDLYNQEGDEYFEKYFKFTLIEYFGMQTDKKTIGYRENYWKMAFDTREHGLNCN